MSLYGTMTRLAPAGRHPPEPLSHIQSFMKKSDHYNDLAFTTSETFSKDAAGLDSLLVAVNSLCFIAILALFVRQLCMKLVAKRIFKVVAGAGQHASTTILAPQCSCMSPYPHTRRSLTACG